MRQQAEELLREWWEWESMYTPNLGAPRIAPYCKESKTSRQWDSLQDVTDMQARRHILEGVETCVRSLPIPYQAAIGLEMRNRVTGARVWRRGDPNVANYEDALQAVIPKMRAAGLVR